MTDESRPWRNREGLSGRRPSSETYPRPDTSTGRVRHPRTGKFIPAGRVPNKTNGGHKPARRGQ
jgi:hypothetical protein